MLFRLERLVKQLVRIVPKCLVIMNHHRKQDLLKFLLTMYHHCQKFLFIMNQHCQQDLPKLGRLMRMSTKEQYKLRYWWKTRMELQKILILMIQMKIR